jgi:hypothetical protein
VILDGDVVEELGVTVAQDLVESGPCEEDHRRAVTEVKGYLIAPKVIFP